MPIMAITNLKDKHIHNTMEFKIRLIKQIKYEYFFTVNNQDFSETDFAKSFIPSICLIEWTKKKKTLYSI